MPARESYVDRFTTTLTAGISAVAATITPASYSGTPAAGQGDITILRPVVGASVPANVEVLTVTDFAARPWPVLRGRAGTAAVSHNAGDEISGTTLTARALGALTDGPRAAAALYLAATCR